MRAGAIARRCGACERFDSGGFGEVVRLGIREQRCQAPRGPGLVAPLVGFAVVERGREIPTYRGPMLVNGAMDPDADDALKGDAAWILPGGATHDPTEVVELVGELHRHPARGGVTRLGPVKGGAVIGAACAAGEARVRFHITAGSEGSGDQPLAQNCAGTILQRRIYAFS
jgi:hypothetical protein